MNQNSQDTARIVQGIERLKLASQILENAVEDLSEVLDQEDRALVKALARRAYWLADRTEPVLFTRI